MLLYTMLYIVLAYLMLFAALTNSVCLNNASFFFLFKYFLCQGYELSGEIALKNNHYYYYYYYYYVVGYLNSHLHVDIQSSDISMCHTLKSFKNNGQDNTEKIIIRFVNRKKKNDILKKCKNLRGTKVFINEHLTKRNEELAYLARKLKKEGKISSIWTRNCKIYIKPMDLLLKWQKYIILPNMVILVDLTEAKKRTKILFYNEVSFI